MGSPMEWVEGKNTGVGCHFLLQGTFPTQELNLGLLNCRQILSWLSYRGIPCLQGWVAIIPSISYLDIQIPAPIFSILLCVPQDYPLWAAPLTCSFIQLMRSTSRHLEGQRVNFSYLFLWFPPWGIVHKLVVSLIRSHSSARQASPPCCLPGSTVSPSPSSKTVVTP